MKSRIDELRRFIEFLSARFKETDHLFASRLEVDLLVAESGLASFDPATGLCPFWKERRCTARANSMTSEASACSRW